MESKLIIYIDTENGNDGNNGTSFDDAIKTEVRASEIISLRIADFITEKGEIRILTKISFVDII